MVILEWDNIKYTVDQKSGNYKWWNILGYDRTTKKKIILDSVSGTLKSGQMVAVLGPSGAGKTTLIAAISQRIRGNLTGDLIYNGAKLRSEEMTSLSVFVPQTEILMESLTLFEHIYFQSLLRMDRETTKIMHTDNIERILIKLNLISCRDTHINKLSGGERKKLNLACELLSEPLMIFCDEPTTGLDSYSALSVVKTLKQLTNDSEENGCCTKVLCETSNKDVKLIRSRERDSPLKAVLCSVHQPTSDIFHEFTHIIIMSHGRILYQGSTHDAEIFFFKLDLVCPSNYNPAEYYIKLIKATDSPTPIIDKIYQNYKKTQSKIVFTLNEYGNVVQKHNYNRKLVERNKNKIGWLNQFWVLLQRFMLNARRSLNNQIWLLLASLVSAITIVLLYSNIKYHTQSSVQDIEGAMITMSSEIIFTFAYAVLNDFPSEMPMIRRELGEKLYAFSSYYIANCLIILPLIILDSGIFLLVVAQFSSLVPSIVQFGQMFIVLVFAGITANAYGFLVSGLSFDYAKEIAGPVDIVLIGFGGFYLSLKAYSVLKYVSPFFFCNEALSVIYWRDVSEIQCSERVGFPCVRNGTEVLTMYSYTSPGLTIDFIGLSVWTIVAHCFAFFGIRRQIKKDGYY